jgi:hypothetical protein
MPQFLSTKQMVANELKKLKILSDPAPVNRVLRILALDSADMVSNRIQQKGQDSAGVKMKTKSPEKFGAYSKAYGKKRQRKGFQTNHIDFTVEGDLWSAWKVLPINNRSIGVGFTGQEIEKAGWLEDMFGDVFVLTKEEEADILELATFEVNKILQK